MIEKRRIKFRDKEYILIGSIQDGGPIITPDGFDEFSKKEPPEEMVYAYLFRNGIIRRFGKRIGKLIDIEFL